MKTDYGTLREVTPLSKKDCFYVVDRHKTEFSYPIHSHEEYELNFVANAAGVKRIVGDSMAVIGDYDLVLITGKELEHVWEQYECNSKNIREITIQFSADLFFSSFGDKSQFESIRKMFEKAQKGIAFPTTVIMKVYHLLDGLAGKGYGFDSMIDFLTLLYELSLCCDEAVVLSSSAFAKTGVQADSRRIYKVKQYINDNYRHEIRLSELAGLVGMTPAAFCRFFKQSTGRVLSDYIISVRLGHAARLLVDSQMSVSEICYDSGFNNLSNFNRIFRKRKECSPKEFRKNYRKKKLVV